MIIDSSLIGNKFWDNSDKKYDDMRDKFIKGLRNYWETYPYRLKKEGKKGTIRLEGLFGTGGGVSILPEAFPLKKDYSLKQLIDDFCKDNNIPYEIISHGHGYIIFSNKYSRMQYEHFYNNLHSKEAIDKAEIEVYGETSKRGYSISLYLKYSSKIPGEDLPKMKSIIEDDLSIDDINDELFLDKCLSKLEQACADLYYKDGKYVNGIINIYIISERELNDTEENELYGYILRQLEPWKEDFDLKHRTYNIYD